MTPRHWLSLAGDTVRAWWDDGCPRYSAALAFYTLFSLSPVLLIAVAIAGAIFGADAARHEITRQFEGLTGRESALAIEAVLARERVGGASVVATVVSSLTAFVGATAVFSELQEALNKIWGVAVDPAINVRRLVRDRLLSFAIVLGVGFLLLVSLVVSAALAALGGALTRLAPGAAWVYFWSVANFLISFGVVWLLFAMIYKWLPDAKLRWHTVWVGAGGTALLFTIGKQLIGLYLGRASIGSVYGAAGSLIVVLVWVYYSGMILFLGAEFTKVHAHRREPHPSVARDRAPSEAASPG